MLCTKRAIQLAEQEAAEARRKLKEQEERNSRRTTFAYNPKSLRRSMMMRPPVINFETRELREKTEAIPFETYAGDWKFKAYFPKGCKPEPNCRIERLTLDRITSTKPGWEAWSTSGIKTGEGCKLKERRANPFGTTFIKSNQMLFSRAPRFDEHLTQKNATGFYYDEDDRIGDRLFIREKSKTGCYIVYDKKSGEGNLFK